jgi:hypothetical protein
MSVAGAARLLNRQIQIAALLEKQVIMGVRSQV